MIKKILSYFLLFLLSLPLLASAQNGGGGNSGPNLLKLSGTNIVPVNPAWNISANIAAATTTTAGISELATSAEVTTGTDADRTITPAALAGSDIGKRSLPVMVLNTSESCATGDGAGGVFFRVPDVLNGWNLVGVGFGVATAGTTGNMDIQIRNATQTTDILTTKMRVETGETDTITSAQPGVIDSNNDDVATGDKIFFDIDSCQTTPALGAFLNLTFQKP